MAVLLDNVDTNQTSGNFESNGGPAIAIIVADAFSTATVTLQMATTNDAPTPRFVTLSNGAVIENSILKLDYLPSGTLVQAVVSGADGSTNNIFVDILQ